MTKTFILVVVVSACIGQGIGYASDWAFTQVNAVRVENLYDNH